MVSTAANIALENIHKSYGALKVLRGVDLDAYDGDVISIIGSSGSGKSTLLRCINFLEHPNEGTIHIQGKLIHTKKNHMGENVPSQHKQLVFLRQKIGFVFQNFNLWSHMTILENLTLGPRIVLKQSKTEAAQNAMHYLEKVGLADKCHNYPNQLSGGQQQRAAIARTLAMEPRAILFDEPTSALDPELVSEVLNVIRKLAEEGRTLLIVTHEMGFAREVSSQIVFLHHGKVEEKGTPEQVFQNPQSARCKKFLASVLRS